MIQVMEELFRFQPMVFDKRAFYGTLALAKKHELFQKELYVPRFIKAWRLLNMKPIAN